MEFVTNDIGKQVGKDDASVGYFKNSVEEWCETRVISI